MHELDIIIPAYNEEESIADTIKGIKEVVGGNYKIIVVDDASSDNTAKVAANSGAEVVTHPYRIGNGASIKTGLRKATAQLVLLMDADGQHAPEDIPRLLQEIDKFDMVIGARSFSGFCLRNLANRVYNLFASYVTQFAILDLTSGFRLVKRNVALKYLYLLPNGFSSPSTITLSFLKTGRTIKYVPILSQVRKSGRSKINLVYDGVNFMLIIARISTFFAPLRVFLPVSLLFFASGLFYYLYTFISSHRFTNMAVFLLVSSVLIFMLGLISEQISQLRMDKTED